MDLTECPLLAPCWDTLWSDITPSLYWTWQCSEHWTVQWSTWTHFYSNVDRPLNGGSGWNLILPHPPCTIPSDQVSDCICEGSAAAVTATPACSHLADAMSNICGLNQRLWSLHSTTYCGANMWPSESSSQYITVFGLRCLPSPHPIVRTDGLYYTYYTYYIIHINHLIYIAYLPFYFK